MFLINDYATVLFGSLRYVTDPTRLIIAYVVCVLCRFISKRNALN